MLLIASSVMISQTIIGTTSYDVQTNNGAKHRISVYDDGKYQPPGQVQLIIL